MNYHIGRLVLSSLCVGAFGAAVFWWCSFCRLKPAKRTPPNASRNNNSNTQRAENKATDVVIHQHSRKILKMDILMSETFWAHNKWNKIASDIKLVFHLSSVWSEVQCTADCIMVVVYFLSRLVDKLCCLVLEALTRDLTRCDRLSDSETDTESDSDIAMWERDCCGSQNPTTGYSHCRVPGLMDRIPATLVAAVTQFLPGPPCDWNAQPLPVNCILDRILRVQRLEKTGADRVYEAYRAMTHAHRFSGENAPLSDYGYVAGMLGAKTDATPGLSPLHHYLLATTAKDCSVMLAFQRLPDYDGRCVLYVHLLHCTCWWVCNLFIAFASSVCVRACMVQFRKYQSRWVAHKARWNLGHLKHVATWMHK